jgi:hypothetical protein
MSTQPHVLAVTRLGPLTSSISGRAGLRFDRLWPQHVGPMVAGDLRSACKASASGCPELGATPAYSQVERRWRRRWDVASLQGPLLEAANAPVRESSPIWEWVT